MSEQSPGNRIAVVADALWAKVGSPLEPAKTPRDAMLKSVASFLSCLSEDIVNAEASLDALEGLIRNVEADIELMEKGHWRKR